MLCVLVKIKIGGINIKHSECQIKNEWYRCSSKEHGLNCDTCCHWSPEDAHKVKIVEDDNANRGDDI